MRPMWSPCRFSPPASSERGQVAPLVAVLVALAALAAVGLVTVGGLLVDRATARSAADAAALAAAAGSDDDARAVAAANGAELVSLVRDGDEVEVQVQVGRAHARARATAVREVVPPREVRPRGSIP